MKYSRKKKKNPSKLGPRSINVAKENKSMASSSVDHSYNRTQKNVTVNEQASGSQSLGDSESGICTGCKKNITGINRNGKSNESGFCEKQYCFICSHLYKPAFEALSVVHSVSWYCLHCINAVPGVSKVLVRLGNTESQFQSLDDHVSKLELNESASDEQIKKIAHEELEEMHEIEG